MTSCQPNSLNVSSVSSYYLQHRPSYGTFQPSPSKACQDELGLLAGAGVRDVPGFGQAVATLSPAQISKAAGCAVRRHDQLLPMQEPVLYGAWQVAARTPESTAVT